MNEKVSVFVDTAEAMSRLSGLLCYREAGLSAMSPVIRASEDGLHRMLVPLVKRQGDKVMLTSVVYCEVGDGTFADSEDAARFFARCAPSVILRPVPVMRPVPAEGKAGREELLSLFDGIRRKVASCGECPREEHYEYLRRLLYPFSDELCEVFLTLCRGYETYSSREVACPSCGRKFSKDVTGCVPGQLVLMDCPYCRGAVRMTYKKEGRCFGFKEAYLSQERGIFEGTVEKTPAPDAADECLEDKTFCLSSAREEERKEKDADGGKRVEGKPEERQVGPFLKELPQAEPSQGGTAGAEELVGLAGIKKIFGVVRQIRETGDYPRAQAYRVTGGPGMGILSSIRRLSGTDGVTVSSLRELSLGALSKVRSRAIVIPCEGGPETGGVSLYSALRALDPSNEVFFLAGDGEAPGAAQGFILQTIRFKPYSDSELFAIYKEKLKTLGSELRISQECEGRHQGRMASSLDAARLARETHFRHLLYVSSGKVSGSVIEEREFERLARELMPLPKAILGEGKEGKA